jgi:hypothetical protein
MALVFAEVLMMNILIEFVSSVSVICLAYAIGYGLWFLIQIPTRRWREMAFDYVYVNDDGSVRELKKEEEDKLSALFFVGDEAEDYIKPRYEALNPLGRSNGYLKRHQLPNRAAVARTLNS